MIELRRWTSVRDYRARLREKHRSEELLDDNAIHRSELVFNLSRLMNRLGQDFETLHHPNRISWSGFRIMNVLWVLGSVELREIARLSGSSRASIWSALKTLERDELVSRMKDSRDKRLVQVTLTRRGSSLFSESVRAQADREYRWFAVFSDSELGELRTLLERLADQPILDEPLVNLPERRGGR